LIQILSIPSDQCRLYNGVRDHFVRAFPCPRIRSVTCVTLLGWSLLSRCQVGPCGPGVRLASVSLCLVGPCCPGDRSVAVIESARLVAVVQVSGRCRLHSVGPGMKSGPFVKSPVSVALILV